jgi:putative endonuclease
MAFYFLRRQGYTIVARNWRCKGRKGEVDLIGWDGKTLCFIEVKTRRSHAVATAESAVDRAKQVELRGMAALFLRKHNPRPQFRFDVVSIYLIPGEEPEIELFKDAFSRRSMSGKRRL